MDKKFLIGIIIFTVAVIGVGIFLTSGTPSKAVLEKTGGTKIETPETKYDFGTIKLNGGNVQHAFAIKNTGKEDLRIANLSSSCHCTKVHFEKKGQKGPAFGMKGAGGDSDWVGILKPNEEGKLITVFDPAFHGPQGIGSISRIVSAETNDPDSPYVEFNFSANVIK